MQSNPARSPRRPVSPSWAPIASNCDFSCNNLFTLFAAMTSFRKRTVSSDEGMTSFRKRTVFSAEGMTSFRKGAVSLSEKAFRAQFPQVQWVFFEPDVVD